MRTQATLWGGAVFVLLAACRGGPGDSAAIEITGYLEAQLVDWTADASPTSAAPVPVVVFGEPGAVVDAVELRVINVNTQEELAVLAGDEGAFVSTVDATAGDVVRVEVGEDSVAIDIGELRPFPEYDVLSVTDEGPLDRIDLTLLSPVPGGRPVVTNRSRAIARPMLGGDLEFWVSIEADDGDDLYIHIAGDSARSESVIIAAE